MKAGIKKYAYKEKEKDNLTLEYQKMIDQTTSVFATIYSGIVVFGIPQVSSSIFKFQFLCIICCFTCLAFKNKGFERKVKC